MSTEDEDRIKRAEQSIRDLFPIGQERWVKVKFIDFNKSLKAFKMTGWSGANDEERGYGIHAISFGDEHFQQLEILRRMKEQLDKDIEKLSKQLELDEDGQ